MAAALLRPRMMRAAVPAARPAAPCPNHPAKPPPISPPGRKVWHLRVDVHVLDHGGNLTGACGLASLAALMAFRRPDATLGGDDGQVWAGTWGGKGGGQAAGGALLAGGRTPSRPLQDAGAGVLGRRRAAAGQACCAMPKDPPTPLLPPACCAR